MISVIIAAYNEEAFIGRCLESIKNQTFKDFEILVIDGNSKDKTVEIVRRYTDKIFYSNKGSPGPARNVGVNNCSGDIVAFTDADTVVDSHWLERMDLAFKDPKVVGVGGILRPLDARLLDKIMFKINSDWFYRFTALFGFYQFGTPNCAYRKEPYLKLGGFNEQLSFIEDTDLSIRMTKMGKMKVDKNMIVYNSARRFQQEGYTKIFIRYIKGYINMFLGKGVKLKHFDTIKH
jgi:glycosyltransferase involved in cell wall biosynthesis